MNGFETLQICAGLVGAVANAWLLYRMMRPRTPAGPCGAPDAAEPSLAPEPTPILAACNGRVSAVRRLGKALFADVETPVGVRLIYVKHEDFSAAELDAIAAGVYLKATGEVFTMRTGGTALEAQSIAFIHDPAEQARMVPLEVAA